MYYADTLGLDKVRDGLLALMQKRVSPTGNPAELFFKLFVQESKGFHSLNHKIV